MQYESFQTHTHVRYFFLFEGPFLVSTFALYLFNDRFLCVKEAKCSLRCKVKKLRSMFNMHLVRG